MSFPRYPEYKPSGNELLGEIPEEWDVWKLAHAFNQIGSGTTPKSDKPEYYDDGSIPWINTGDLEDGPLRDCSKRISEKATEDHSTLKLYPSGSLIFAMYGATIGKLGILEFPATVNQACCVFSGGSKITREFLFYWFLGLRQKILSLATGGGQPNVSQDILRTLRVACPEPDEQTAIAEFLDRETSKIDDLIAEQKRLIELLKEKRQAVISHAVTKGLNPDVPMKDSGIEWLGKVPEHWEVWKVGRRFEIRVGKMLDSSKITGKFLKPYLRVADVQWGTIKVEDLPEMDFDDDSKKKFRLIDGDLLVNEGGSYVGRCAIWREQLEECYYQKALHRLRPLDKSKDSTDFFFYVMLYATQLGVFVAGGNQNTIDHLPAEALRQYKFAFPPLDEQIDLANQIADLTHDLDKLCTQAEQAIELLQERRTALISAAVTGKIDVRKHTITKKPKKGASPHFRRTVFAAEIIDQLCDEQTFGRVKFQKCLFLAQHFLRAGDFAENYTRMVAGPFDNRLLRSVESQLKKKQWFAVVKSGKRYAYQRLKKIGDHRTYFERYYGSEQNSLNSLLDLLRPLDTDQCEIIATLFAVWNDFLIQREEFDNNRIVSEVLTNWDESKMRFSKERWLKALEWMRVKGIVPTGFGKPTIIATGEKL